MSVLADGDIARLIKRGKIKMEPYDELRVQPASYDLALSNQFRVFKRGSHTFIDPLRKQEGLTELVTLEPGETFILHPNQLALGMTEEFVGLPPDIAARVEGKSSLGRIGLMIHATAGWIDPGYNGTVTLELGNAVGLPIVLTPGMKIAQIAFLMLNSPAVHPYGTAHLGSKYQGDTTPQESLAHKEARDGRGD